ncbi:putative MPP superfamily phosphohydrolase [Actinorugispora endophytica]|uniref:Putative MPP superfamily phosphohydrolase n=2 Tax=Actinorugispora endophytica TaxID=1605990 RepID=A0A4R6V8A2_9ACTN|nr:putative MPP superfamily phosphohydrolase [Actinorugispora endophytica]
MGRAGRALRGVGKAAAVAGAVGVAGFAYASVIERNWFRLRRYEIPVLAPGSARLRVLHLSDAHLTPGRRMLIDWIRGLDAYQPDLVVNTGDSLAHPDAVTPFVDALGPLLDRPGLFVYGSNDLFSPRLKNPARYLWRSSKTDYNKRTVPDLPWRALGAAMSGSGWLDLNNHKGRLKAGGLDIAVAGVHDSHINMDRYEKVAGTADPAADLRLGVMHSPEPRNLDRFTADGYDLLLAGHTHGGQVCLPFYGTLVTNCGIDRARAWGLSRNGASWLHVSGGMGTSPYAPVRFCCRPEAALLDLVPRS